MVINKGKFKETHFCIRSLDGCGDNVELQFH